MILTFPRPYPDELLYSLYARYHVQSGNTSKKGTIAELFGVNTAYPVMDLPGHLGITAERLGYPWTSEILLLNHTLYPYYAYYLPAVRANKVKELMVNGDGKNIHSSFGINGSAVKPKTNLWICEDCIMRDMNVYGETYWRRSHQLPYVFFCVEHCTVLSETNVSTKMKSNLSFESADPSLARQRHDLEGLRDQDIQTLLEFSKLSIPILTLNDRMPVGDTVRDQYIAILRELGYTQENGNVRQEDLKKAFCQQFSFSLLEKMNSGIDDNRSAWLRIITQKHHKSFHPVHHLILSLFFRREGSVLELKGSGNLKNKEVKVQEVNASLLKQMKANNNQKAKKKIREKTVNKYKEKWLALMKEYPGASRSELRIKDPRTYNFFGRNEKEWFNVNSPPAENIKANRLQQLWEERDIQLLQQTIQLIEKWDEGEMKISRITISRIGRRLGKSSMLNKHMEKLPKTKEYIDGVIEDDKTFIKRNIRFVILNAQRNGDNLAVWEILNKVGAYRNFTEEGRKYVESQLAIYTE